MNTLLNGAVAGLADVSWAPARTKARASSAPVAAMRGQWRMTRMYSRLRECGMPEMEAGGLLVGMCHSEQVCLAEERAEEGDRDVDGGPVTEAVRQDARRMAGEVRGDELVRRPCGRHYHVHALEELGPLRDRQRSNPVRVDVVHGRNQVRLAEGVRPRARALLRHFPHATRAGAAPWSRTRSLRSRRGSSRAVRRRPS